MGLSLALALGMQLLSYFESRGREEVRYSAFGSLALYHLPFAVYPSILSILPSNQEPGTKEPGTHFPYCHVPLPHFKTFCLDLQQTHPMAQETRDPQLLLQQVFGYDQFRPHQREAIEQVLSGQDALVIMPTGGGKSLCYQIPALVKDGVALVISPLIALMKDQVEALRTNGINAHAINSTLDSAEKIHIHEEIRQGKVKLLYVSPEKVMSPSFLDYLATLPLTLVAIDEAHCVSMWGNDFRPEYAQLSGVIQRLPGIPVIALTATADPATQTDIVKQLGLRSPGLFLGSFARENLHIEVQPASQRMGRILRFLQDRQDQPGIVYCLSRKSTEKVAEQLRKEGFRAAHYHAKMDRQERDRVQEDFQRDNIQIICATIAFGMGIDKSNIRWIIHYNLPKNIESYYQEIGRAGRDGVQAHTLLFAGFGDVMTYRMMITDSESPEAFKEVQIQKLDRMFSYSQATSCRTNAILSYFGESRLQGCGHCDRCDQPVTSFDGTQIAQMALSAIARVNQTVGLQLLVDILRGAGTREIREGGYDRVKTYGAGRGYSRDHWVQYLTQLIDRGLVSIDYTEYGHLKMTSIGQDVLFGRESVSLTRPENVKEKETREKVKKETPRQTFRRELLARITQWRKRCADQEGVSPANILSDATLVALMESPTLFTGQLEEIPGFSAHKRGRYGPEIIREIRSYYTSQEWVKSIKGATYLETLDYLQAGTSLEEIMHARGLGLETLYGHLAWMIEHGEHLEIDQYVTAEEQKTIQTAWLELGQPESINTVMQYLPEGLGYGKIKLAIAGWHQIRKEEVTSGTD